MPPPSGLPARAEGATKRNWLGEAMDRVEASVDQEGVTLQRFVNALLRADKETPEAWGESLGRFLATPLTALLDHELAQVNRAIADESKTLGLPRGSVPVVRWSGIEFV
mmetsp:Transcript_109635/g.236046  ORF Transcript_109635/g.236046 Transcript_109635/m.236046 type:complete len:109 (-) Transcript_109635:103-429(-)